MALSSLYSGSPPPTRTSRGHVLRCVKLAARWLKRHGGRVRRDYSSLKLKDGKRVIVPAFTEAEIRSIVASIDTGSAVGKRDLAIILLAYCTGLRGIDIRRLKLTDIDWRGQSVTLTQSKNYEPITCVLNGETMNALADYVLEGRPDCGLEEVFVTCLAPHRPLAANLHHMLDKPPAAGTAWLMRASPPLVTRITQAITFQNATVRTIWAAE